MNRNQKRTRTRELKKELEVINNLLDAFKKKMPDMYKLFDENEGDFRAGTYKDDKAQSLYNYMSDMVNRAYAIEETIRELTTNKGECP